MRKNKKKYIYYLIDNYLNKKIDATTFCDEFHVSYNIEIDYDELSSLENKMFSELRVIAGRFSEFEEDHKKYPGTYFTEKQLRDKIIEVRNKLKDNIPNSNPPTSRSL